MRKTLRKILRKILRKKTIWCAAVCVAIAVLGTDAIAQSASDGQSKAATRHSPRALIHGLGDRIRQAGFWNADQDNAVPTCPICQGAVSNCRLCSIESGWSHATARYHARFQQQSRLWGRYLQRRLAYFTPSGCCGEGCPPFGGYHLVYAVNPDYFDARDGQLFAAPGAGVPMAVPLAPNVHYSYNYSSGIPSSRITPISNAIPPRRIE